MNDSKIRIECPKCGHSVYCKRKCPVTGWEYSSGWVIPCPVCKTSMKKKDNPQLTEDDFIQAGIESKERQKSANVFPARTCSMCGDPSYVLYFREKFIKADAFILGLCCKCEDNFRKLEGK